MLIDAHCHVWIREMLPNWFLRSMAWRESRKELPFGTIDEWLAKSRPHYFDPGAERWIKIMESCGIDACVNVTNDFGSAEGFAGDEAPMSVEEINFEYCQWSKRLKGKFYTFIGVNPLRGKAAVELLEKGVKEWGALGLKLLPHTGFYPNDRICYPLYEKCLELGVPVNVHTGAGIFRYSKYANPVHLEEAALDFPELEFIAAHAGGGIGELWQEMCVAARYIPNINLEMGQVAPTVIKGGFRGSKGKYKDHTPDFIDMLDVMRNTLIGGCANILFGTDMPTFPAEILKEWCDLFRNLPEIASRYGYDFSQEEADLMCYKNVARIMKLNLKEIEEAKSKRPSS